MKRLIVCCDGTWNTPEQEENNIPAPTNVVRLHNALAETDAEHDGNPQLAYYHPGVGTEGGFFARTVGGAFGEGLDKNIMSAYGWLARNYAVTDGTPDAIYLFGFSRGAYTARSLGGFIGRCGLPRFDGSTPKEAWKRIETAYQRGYSENKSNWRHADWPWLEPGTIPIEFIGVWDTVGALGVPDDLALINIFDDPEDWRFHDTKLGAQVKHARHAVAMDDIRASFAPTLWTDDAGNPMNDGVRVKQLWFPGVHCDVGGGYGVSRLSDIALKWMIDEAADAGLRFRADMVAQIDPHPRGPLHNSFKGVFKSMRCQPRSLPLMETGASAYHPSAIDRFITPPITQSPYCRTSRLLQPGESKTVTVYAREMWNATCLFLDAGAEYEFAAEGEWLDRDIPCGPGGTSDGKFHLGELVQMVGTVLGKIEGVFRTLSNNPRADFKATRRVESMPWFSLVGVIANGGNPLTDGTVAPHEELPIGAGPLRVKVTKPGYLYAFANDAWHFYDNNRGSVTMTVKRVG